VEKYFESNSDMQQQVNLKMKEEVEKWGRHMCGAQGVKEAMDREGLLVKSSSLPRMLVEFELEDAGEERMVIE
jgi:hypothetical protein